MNGCVYNIDWSSTEPVIAFAGRQWFMREVDGGTSWVTHEGDRIAVEKGLPYVLNGNTLLSTERACGILEMFQYVSKSRSLMRFFYRNLKQVETAADIEALLIQEEEAYIEETQDYTGFAC
ncbi:MAG: hypothetical protein HY986_10815 [Candidatus Melainabacteria bacterium]|nr:hypothetical protein [Candidatus Melainabacteria bacterium]